MSFYSPGWTKKVQSPGRGLVLSMSVGPTPTNSESQYLCLPAQNVSFQSEVSVLCCTVSEFSLDLPNMIDVNQSCLSASDGFLRFKMKGTLRKMRRFTPPRTSSNRTPSVRPVGSG